MAPLRVVPGGSMKRAVHAVLILMAAMVAMPLFAADRTNIIDDVIRMTRAGVAEESIVEFVHKSDARFDVNADDMIAMTDAKVSRFVMKALLDEADVRNGRPEAKDVYEQRTVIVRPYYAYDPYPYYYDPF